MFYRIAVLQACFLFALFPAFCQGQLTCSDFRNGTFYSYPKNTSDQYVIQMADDQQTEINLKNNDTSVWQMERKGDCSYTLKYLSGGKTFTPAMYEFTKKHKLFFEIESTTPDYYIYAAYIDKRSGVAISKDTMWVHEKVSIPNNEVFKKYETNGIPEKEHFSDTSAYAVLYLYRPGKLTNSLGNFIVYFNDDAMWVAQNNSGMMFKIIKPGKYRITSKLLKDETAREIDIQPGKKYYLKTKINWGLFKHLYNFRLEIEEPDAATGKAEFRETSYR